MSTKSIMGSNEIDDCGDKSLKLRTYFSELCIDNKEEGKVSFGTLTSANTMI
jgi:hypothetical protein